MDKYEGLLFPEGTEVTIYGENIVKPWGGIPSIVLRMELGELHKVSGVISMVNTLWEPHAVRQCCFYFPGERGRNDRVLGSFYLFYSPEAGFYRRTQSLPVEQGELKDILQAHYFANPDETPEEDPDGRCQLCGNIGNDRRRLAIACTFDIKEVVPEFTPVEQSVGRSRGYRVRLCGECRNKFVDTLPDWAQKCRETRRGDE